MPNHCENKLVIRAKSEADLKLILDDIAPHNERLDFELIIPLPEDEDWYRWSIVNWGTKWNAYECTMDISGDWVEFDFQTAWSPPEPIVRALGKKYPNAIIGLSYREEGCDFEGVLILQNEKIIEEHSRDCMPSIHSIMWMDFDDEE